LNIHALTDEHATSTLPTHTEVELLLMAHALEFQPTLIIAIGPNLGIALAFWTWWVILVHSCGSDFGWALHDCGSNFFWAAWRTNVRNYNPSRKRRVWELILILTEVHVWDFCDNTKHLGARQRF
jgi:hypothetical protein